MVCHNIVCMNLTARCVEGSHRQKDVVLCTVLGVVSILLGGENIIHTLGYFVCGVKPHSPALIASRNIALRNADCLPNSKVGKGLEAPAREDLEGENSLFPEKHAFSVGRYFIPRLPKLKEAVENYVQMPVGLSI